MKILSIGNFGTGWDGSICDEEHIAGALEELGHEVIRWQREDVGHAISRGGSYDFILVAQWDNYSGDMLTNLKEISGSPIVYWAFDYQADGQIWHDYLIAESDLYLSKRIADSKYPNWQWLSQDFAPKFLDRTDKVIDKDIDVLFTGSYLPWATERNETLKAVDDKFNLVIHSVNAWEGFKDVRPPIMDEGLPELYTRAKVILSIDHTLEAGYWSDRNAQIIACGSRPLFRYVPMSEAVFHDDVDYFYSVEDCLKKIQDRLDGTTYIHNPPKVESYKVIARIQDLLIIVQGIL